MLARELAHEASVLSVLARPPLDAMLQIDGYLFVTCGISIFPELAASTRGINRCRAAGPSPIERGW